MPSQQTEDEEFPNRGQRFILCIAAIALPPLPVFLLSGPNYTVFTKEFLITLLLTVFGHLPGAIFALYFIFVVHPSRYRRANSDYISLPRDEESRVHHDEDERSPLGISRVSQPDEHHESLLVPPKYEDIVTEPPAVSDSKSSDNKVQH